MQLDNWQTHDEDKEIFNIHEDMGEDFQEWHAQELILIDRSIGKLVLLVEKLDLLIDKNDRMVKKAQLKIEQEALTQMNEQLSSQVDSLRQ
jgi:hypothetical protein